MEKIKKAVCLHLEKILLLLLIIPAIFPLFRSGFFPMHDDQQVVRLYEMDRALAAGQFPARWAGKLGFGYGYPLFIFYPPFVYYLGEAFHLLLGTGFLDSTKLVFAAAFLGAGFSMYKWVKYHFGKTAALVAALFYTYAPYHAVDAYVRGALAELASFIWLPLILWSADRVILKKQNRYFIWMGSFLALLMITHNLVFLAFFPLFLIYVGILSLKSQSKPDALSSLPAVVSDLGNGRIDSLRKIAKRMAGTLYSILFAAGLSAFFWIPALAEKKYTLVDSILLADLADYKLHFVYPSQLWNSLWGYGGSTAGPLDGLSFKIGKLHIILSGLALCLWAVFGKRKDKESQDKLFHCLIAAILFLASAFMTTGFSRPIWELLTPLQYLQFPWRYLTFTALFSSFLAGGAVAAVHKIAENRILKTVAAAVLITILFLSNLKLFQPQEYLQVDESYYLSDEFIKWKISKTSFEFLPKGIETRQELTPVEKKEITQVAISKDQIAKNPLQILSGEAEINIKHNMPGRLIFSSKSNQIAKIQLNIFDFPGWKVKLDGRQVKPDSDNRLKLMLVSVPEGDHTVSAEFKNSLIRSIANLISLLSLSVPVLGLLRSKRILRYSSFWKLA